MEKIKVNCGITRYYKKWPQATPQIASFRLFKNFSMEILKFQKTWTKNCTENLIKFDCGIFWKGELTFLTIYSRISILSNFFHRNLRISVKESKRTDNKAGTTLKIHWNAFVNPMDTVKIVMEHKLYLNLFK